MHRLSPSEALEAASRAVDTGRVRLSKRAEAQIENEGLVADVDVEGALRSATTADRAQPPEHWILSGGTTPEGEPLTIEIEVLDTVVRILDVRR